MFGSSAYPLLREAGLLVYLAAWVAVIIAFLVMGYFNRRFVERQEAHRQWFYRNMLRIDKYGNTQDERTDIQAD